MPGPINPQLATTWCTDEDIAVRSGPDYWTLAPHDQVLAAGSDGVFASGFPWVMTSATNAFDVQGVAVGSVVLLTTPIFKGSGSKFGVSAVSGNTITLRTLGSPDGMGVAPGPPAGITGVTFAIRTLKPQIEDASYRLNSRFGIDPNFALSAPKLIYDPRQLNQACALMVIGRMLATSTRTKDGDFARKLGIFQDAQKAAEAILQVRWNQYNDNPPPTTFFGTRIGR
jgi:hypothetical protein